MSKELPSYYDHLESICKAFPSRDLLIRKDISAFTGLSKTSVPKTFPYSGKYITRENFARALSRMGVIEGK